MIYDFRVYTLRPGATPDYMAAVKEVALPIREKYGIKLAGWYYSDVGDLNQVVHIWGYDSLDDRLERRDTLARHPDWPAYLKANLPLIVEQENRVLIPASFSPLK